MINSILCNVSAYFVCHCFQLFRSICHCYTSSNGLKHFDVIITISESNRFFRIKVIMFQYFFQLRGILPRLGEGLFHRRGVVGRIGAGVSSEKRNYKE